MHCSNCEQNICNFIVTTRCCGFGDLIVTIIKTAPCKGCQCITFEFFANCNILASIVLLKKSKSSTFQRLILFIYLIYNYFVSEDDNGVIWCFSVLFSVRVIIISYKNQYYGLLF